MDPYTNPDQQSDTTLKAMITRLEERAKHSVFEGMIQDYIAEIPSDQPLVVLDFGCGTGVVIRALEPVLHPDCELHGADISTQLLQAARALSMGTRIHWDKVEPQGLPYSRDTFDVIIMHTLLSHVPDPEATLKEAARLLKPSGRLIVFDADHAGTTFGLMDFSKMRECDFRLTSALASQPEVARGSRRDPRLAARWGLARPSVAHTARCGPSLGRAWIKCGPRLAALHCPRLAARRDPRLAAHGSLPLDHPNLFLTHKPCRRHRRAHGPSAPARTWLSPPPRGSWSAARRPRPGGRA